MRVGKPNELRVPAFPLLTARISEAELTKWFPVSFHHTFTYHEIDVYVTIIESKGESQEDIATA